MMNIVRAHISLEDSPVSMQLSFPRFLLFFLVLIKRTVQLSLLILVINLFAHWMHKHFLETAQDNKTRLYSRFQNLSEEIDSLENKIFETYNNEELLYTKFGLATPDTNMREMGLGGPIFPDSALMWSAVPIKKLRATVEDKFNRTKAKIDRSNDSYLKLQTYIERLHGNLLHIPSIAPAIGFFSSGFGTRTHPITGEREKMHYGIDISAQRWTSIRAPANGRVEKVADSETLGRYVSIDHGNGIVTRYGHMERAFVVEGQIITRFDIIGYMGNTGRSTGNHLHYEVWVNGEAVNPIYYILPEQYSVE